MGDCPGIGVIAADVISAPLLLIVYSLPKELYAANHGALLQGPFLLRVLLECELSVGQSGLRSQPLMVES
jgi:hypothetical protein